MRDQGDLDGGGRVTLFSPGGAALPVGVDVSDSLLIETLLVLLVANDLVWFVIAQGWT